MKKYIELAALLFLLELERISAEPEFHFEFNSWFDKFGDSSIKFESKLKTNDEDVEKLAAMLKTDFEKGEWNIDKEGGLYHYRMPEYYGGFIVECLEVQLADMTKVGTQLAMF